MLSENGSNELKTKRKKTKNIKDMQKGIRRAGAKSILLQLFPANEKRERSLSPRRRGRKILALQHWSAAAAAAAPRKSEEVKERKLRVQHE